MAAVLGPVIAAGAVVPVPAAVTAAVAAAGAVATAVATAVPAKAATSLPVLVVQVNGESSAPEAALLTSAGYTVTQVTTTALQSMSKSAFQGYAAVVIGDPSSGGSCASGWTSAALTSALGTSWEGWVTGNVAVLGTNAGLAASLASSGNTAAQTLITDAAEYAAAQPGTTVTRTGLYLSLGCAYATAAQGTPVPVLDGIYTDTAATQTIGAVGHVTLNGGLSCADSGTVNKWEAAAAGTFGGFTSGSLAAGAPGWPSPGCPVQEAFDSWPATFTPVAYDAATGVTKNFTASDGVTGQPYILLGAAVSVATTALAPSTGGEVPAGTTSGGTSNPAAGGVSQALAAGSVNTENGDLTQSDTDLSIPTFGPALSFSRTYDSGTAQQQTKTGIASTMGTGWTDNWASSLTTVSPVEGDIYTLAGMRANQGAGGQPNASLTAPGGVVQNNSNLYIADSVGNRVLEIPNAAGTQWGVSMPTAKLTYVIAGSGTPAGGVLNHPQGLAFDSAGDLYIADTWDSRIEEIPVSNTTQWGISMTAGHMYTIAGNAGGATGTAGDNGPPTSAYLHAPGGIALDASGDLYIADGGNNRVQEIYVTGGNAWGVSPVTAGDIYTVAGSAAGTAGISGDGGASRSAYLSNPTSVSTDSSGDVYISDAGNNRIQEMAAAAGTQWGVPSMAVHGIYTIAGSATGTAGSSGDTGAATSALLDGPQYVSWSGSNLYIADALNNKVREIAGTNHTQWGSVSMTANHIYNLAGTGTPGYTGDSGIGTSGTLNNPLSLALGSGGDLYIADANNNHIRKLAVATGFISTYAGNGYTVGSAGDGGPATQAGLYSPMQEAFDSSGDIYIADAGNNRIQEIAASTHTQYGIAMTGGEVYTIAGQANGQYNGTTGSQSDGTVATNAYLNDPWGIVVDPAGNLYIADTGNNRIREVPLTSHTQFNTAMTAGDIYTIAGQASGVAGNSGDLGLATSAYLNDPNAIAMDAAGNIYISDSWNNRVQEIAAVSGTQWGQSMTAGDIYTIAGDQNSSGGSSGDGGPATAARLVGVGGLAFSPAGDLYIGDGGNNRVQELAKTTHTQWGQTMTANDIYTVTGTPGGGATGDGGPASAALIAGAQSLATDASGDLYIGDEQNNRIQEIANINGTQWGQSMTNGDIYTVAGNANRASGNSGDGGPATGALLANTESISADPEGDLYITDNGNATVREVASATPDPIAPAPGQTSSLVIAPVGTAPGGLTVTQPGGAQVTFWAQQTGGGCATGYDPDGNYCILPQDQGATLTYNSSTQAYTFSPGPGATTYTYLMTGTLGQLTSETDTAGDTLTITYNSPAPGGTVTGNGTCPAAAASCQTITAAHPAGTNGRALILGYNGNLDSGQITSVTDPMNRTWTYTYAGTAPNVDLQSVTGPAPDGSTPGSTTSYQYGDNSGGLALNPLLANDLISITSPNAQSGGPDAGDATHIVYNPAGQVTNVTDPMGWKTIISYCAPAPGDCLNSATGTGLVTVTDPDGNQTVYDYDQGTLAAQSAWTKTPSSLTLTSENDSVPDTTAASTSNPSGGSLLVTSSSDGDGKTATNSYDTHDNSTSATSQGANGVLTTITFGYAEQNSSTAKLPDCNASAEATVTCAANPGPAPVPSGQVITPPSQVPPAGASWTQYDSEGNDLYTEIGVSQPGGGSTAQVTYELHNGNSVTLPGSGTTVTCAATAPSAQLTCATINASGMVTQLAYDSAGDLISSSVPNGYGSAAVTTTYGYDADGEQISTTSPDGNLPSANPANYTTTSTFNGDGEQTSVTDGGAAGHTVTLRTTTTTYDADGNAITHGDALGKITTTAYNADDQAEVVTDADGNTSLTCYDGDGHAVQTVPPAGVAAGSLTASSCPSAYPAGYSDRLAADATASTYNAAGEVTVQTTPLPPGQTGPNQYETTTHSYDANGNLVETITPSAATGGQSITTYNTYNPAGELATQTTGYGTPAAATISYCYDPEGNKTSVVTADGNANGVAPCQSSAPWTVSALAYPAQASYQTVYAYNSGDQLTSVTRPGATPTSPGAVTTYTYDAGGALVSTASPNGVTSTMTYTPDGQVASISYSGSAAPNVTYGYDADGRLTSVTDGTGSRTSTYDSFGELTSTQNGNGQTVSYSYDADGHQTGITYPLPAAATWATSSTVAYGYDNAGALISVTDLKGSKTTITPTRDGQTSAVFLGTTGDSLNYAYGQDGSLSSIALKDGGGTTLQSFGYADAPGGEILNETDTPVVTGPSASYSYDGKGRLTSAVPGTGSPASYSYDSSGNLLTLPGAASASYGDNGALAASTLSGVTASFAFDADGNRTGSTQGGVANSSGTWNGADQLTAYTVPVASMTGAAYNSDGNRTAASFTTSSGTSSENYVWNGNSLLMDSQNAYIYAGSEYTPAEQVSLATGAVTYLVTDSIGSIRGTVNEVGALTGTASYDAWGNPRTAGGLTAATPFGYAGGYTDQDGLIYLINRYYDPQTGQFTSLDPEVDQTLAPYAYTGGNPVSQTDPTGQWTSSCRGGGGPDASPRYNWALWFTCDQIRQAINNSYDFKQIKFFNSIKDSWDAASIFGPKVYPGASWDLKIYLKDNVNGDAIDNVAPEHGEANYYARVSRTRQIFLNVWGNIFFGYVGRAGEFSTGQLKDGVALYGLAFPNFNNPGNVIERQMGYDLFDNHPDSLSDANINRQIGSEEGKFNIKSKCDLMAFPGSWAQNKSKNNPYYSCSRGTGPGNGW
jgi:RHS repeat-associated protein